MAGTNEGKPASEETARIDRIVDRACFDHIRYANVWEDADILCEALRPGPGKRILSIASGGDNAFALAAEGAEVVAADISLAQIACCELKMAAIRRLDQPDALAFLGVIPAEERKNTYRILKRDLSETSRTFWDLRPKLMEAGIVHAGKFERYFALFRDWVIPLVHGRDAVDALLEEKSEEELRTFYARIWNNRRWRLLLRLFTSRFVMGKWGRDPEFFRYVEGSVSAHILERTRYGLAELPTHANPYLHYIMRGTFLPALPRYLREENYERTRAGLRRVTLVRDGIDAAGRSHVGPGFDGYNLSDIFEYIDPQGCVAVYGALLDMARPGARFAYWNMMVPRACPAPFANRVRPLPELSEALFKKDLAFFYRAFVVEEVLGGGGLTNGDGSSEL